MALAVALVLLGAWWLVVDGLRFEALYASRPAHEGPSSRGLWLVGAAIAAVAAAGALRPRLRVVYRLPRRSHAHGACPSCGYDLAGLPSLRCPECGRIS